MCRPSRFVTYRVFAAVLTGMACTTFTTLARADDGTPRETPAWRGEVDTVLADTGWQSPGRLDGAYDPAAARGMTARRAMLWSSHGALHLGLGVQQPMAATGSAAMADGGRPLQAPRLLLGASLDTSGTTQLQWRTPLRTSLVSDAEEPRLMEVSLVLKPQDPLAHLRRGSLMKLELGGQTQLSLRPRGGKVMLRLTSQW